MQQYFTKDSENENGCFRMVNLIHVFVAYVDIVSYQCFITPYHMASLLFNGKRHVINNVMTTPHV